MKGGPVVMSSLLRRQSRRRTPARLLLPVALLACAALVLFGAMLCRHVPPSQAPDRPREAGRPETAALKGRSTLVLANLDQRAPAAVTLRYRRPDGSAAGEQHVQLPPGSTATLQGAQIQAPEGFSGSVELTSDRPVRLLVQHAAPGRRSATYDPALLREALYHDLRPLWKTSTIIVYNPGDMPGTVAFSAREEGNARPLVEHTALALPPHGRLELSLERLAELPPGWTGVGSIRSLTDTPVRVLVLHTDARRTYVSTSHSIVRDVCDLCPHAGAISMLISAGVLSPGPDGSFRPAEPLTQEEAERIRAAEGLPAGAVPVGIRRDEAAARVLEALRRQPSP